MCQVIPGTALLEDITHILYELREVYGRRASVITEPTGKTGPDILLHLGGINVA